MAFEPTYEKVVSGFRKKLGTTQAVIECKLPVNEGRVSKILCVDATSFVVGSEVVDNVVTFNGFVSFHAIYENENAEIEGLDYTAEFRDKYVCDDATNMLAPVVTSAVIDIQSTPQENEIKVVAILEIHVDGILGDETEVLIELNDNNSFTKKETLNFVAYSGIISDRYDVSHDVEILDSVSRVLGVCPSAYLEKITKGNRLLTVKGGVNFDICYVCDNGTIRTMQGNHEFVTEIANDSVEPESNIQSLINAMLNDIKISTALDVDKAIVTINVPVRFLGYIFNPRNLDIISDVFNANHYLNVDYENINIQKFQTPNELVERITGNATLDDNMAFMDEVLGNCCNRVVLANNGVQEGRLLLEGVAYTTVIYLNKEENKTYSTQVEIPFSILANINNLTDDLIPLVNIAIGDVVAKGKRGKEIDINAKLYIYVDFYNTINDAVIANVMQADEKIFDDLVLSLYIAKEGDTVWDIAKEMNISPNLIIEQNPELNFPLKAGIKVVIYRQRLLEY